MIRTCFHDTAVFSGYGAGAVDELLQVMGDCGVAPDAVTCTTLHAVAIVRL